MGKLQAKVGLVAVLSKFSFELVDKNLMKKEIEFEVPQFVLTPNERILMKITPRFK